MSTSSTPSNRYIHIEDLVEKVNIEDENLIIVEDEDDTKKASIKELKKVFSGDFKDPTRELFYTSAKVKELYNDLMIAISMKASEDDIKDLKTRLANLVLYANVSDKDPEIIEARGDNVSLSERFVDERNISDISYLKTIQSKVSGNEIQLNGFKGKVEIFIASVDASIHSIAENALVVQSKNLLNYRTMKHTGHEYEDITVSNRGFSYTQGLNITTDKDNIEIIFEVASATAGHYYLKGSVNYDELFGDKEISLRIHYTDDTYIDIPYLHQSALEFDATKPFSSIGFIYKIDNIVHNTTVSISNIMLSKYDVTEYISFYRSYYSPNIGDSIIINNKDYILYCTDPSAYMIVTYLDHKTTTESILKRIDDIEVSLGTVVEKCGLMEDYGTLQLFDTCEIIGSDISGYMVDGEYDFKRNGIFSKKVTISGVGNLHIKQILNVDVENIENVGVCLYIDKPTFDEFVSGDGIRLILTSDIPTNPLRNYYSYTITKHELVQGWNTIRRNISDFSVSGTPDLYNIKSVDIVLNQNEYLQGKYFYLNSVVFNQRMKPTLILNIEEFQEAGSKYLYPYLTKYNIPATVYLNSSRSLEAEEYDSIIGQRVAHGWDIGGNSCYPNKELLTNNDNYRNQYQALKNTKLYLEENLIYNPISYSGPYGTVMPITVPLLKDLGFKIAKAVSNGYIASFTKKDFVIPSQLISNLITVPEIKARIEYAIRNGLAIAFTVRDVTEYGDEVNATKVIFESIIDYINNKVEAGELQCLTLADFYNRCVE